MWPPRVFLGGKLKCEASFPRGEKGACDRFEANDAGMAEACAIVASAQRLMEVTKGIGLRGIRRCPIEN